MKKALIDKYNKLFLIYLVLSIVLLVTALILTVIYYLTDLKDVITISHLFIVLFAYLMAFYFRVNALHYHRLVVEIKLAINKKRKGPTRKS